MSWELDIVFLVNMMQKHDKSYSGRGQHIHFVIHATDTKNWCPLCSWGIRKITWTKMKHYNQNTKPNNIELASERTNLWGQYQLKFRFCFPSLRESRLPAKQSPCVASSPRYSLVFKFFLSSSPRAPCVTKRIFAARAKEEKKERRAFLLVVLWRLGGGGGRFVPK